MVDRILVMSLTRMGDLVQATPLISGLRKKHPQAKITLMVSSDFAMFVPNIPDIDDSISNKDDRSFDPFTRVLPQRVERSFDTSGNIGSLAAIVEVLKSAGHACLVSTLGASC